MTIILSENEPPKADIERLMRQLLREYAEALPDGDEPGKFWRRAIADQDLERLLRIAEPIYDLVNGKTELLPAITNEDIAKYDEALRQAGHRYFTRILPISITRPPMTVIADWIIPQSHWEQAVFSGGGAGYDNEEYQRAQWRLEIDSGPYLLDVRDFVDRSDWWARSWPFDRGSPAHDAFLMFLGAAEFLLSTNPDEQSRVPDIEQLIPFFLKWPVLGCKPGEPDTLCILVK